MAVELELSVGNKDKLGDEPRYSPMVAVDEFYELG
jgi:hypothetical protein